MGARGRRGPEVGERGLGAGGRQQAGLALSGLVGPYLTRLEAEPGGPHGKERLPSLPLQPIQVEKPFMHWDIDFIGPISPPSSAGHSWILTTMDYFTRWTKAVALREANESVVLNFYDDIVTRFQVPNSIISDNALAFVRLRVSDWAIRNDIYLNTSSNYYPQDRITPKSSIGNSPYVLVYGKEARLPLFVELPTLDIMHQLEMFEEHDPVAVRYAQLMKLKELIDKAMKSMEYNQLQTRKFFDEKATPRVFREGDIVLIWDVLKSRPGQHTKFDKWSGPFIITE
ncbi:uncharacterized protein LOC131065311 [Cryptomeria japonica]|uniref:uncharacterized protein LOC131065311 n=1 Tax=Cryptomeria japonica TaxID=3369 RepID=UPI0027D9EC46|nr:uncharacterized protein LOC131065311 [Cryptomeria japonica]